MRFAADENLNNNIVRGVLRARPSADLVRVQEVGLTGADDPTILAWRATEGRVMLTHDRDTMVAFALDRIDAGAEMPGLIVVRDHAALRTVIDDLVLVFDCAEDDDLRDQVWFVPLS